MAVLFAFISLAGAALSDFTFKRFSSCRNLSMGLFFMVVGATSFALMLPCGVEWTPLPATLLWGVPAGLFSVVANIFLVYSMRCQSAGVCSTIYRLNLVPAALCAWLLLGEEMSPAKWLGLALAAGVVICFRTQEKEPQKIRSAVLARRGVLLCVVASFLRAANGITFKAALMHGVDSAALTAVTSVCWVCGGLAYALLAERNRNWRPERRLVGYGVVSGVFSFTIIFCTALALARGDASVILPIAQMSFPLTFLLSVAFLKERVTRRKCLGVFLAVLAIFLLTR